MLGSVRLQSFYLLALIIVQMACAIYFAYDLINDVVEAKSQPSLYLAIELLACVGLTSAALLEANWLIRLQREYKRIERTLQVAQGNIHDVIQNYFAEWSLTKAEIDVAILAIKGFSIAEIANFRRSQEGTIKTQLSAVYRKAGVKGRNQLGSLLIEDLMGHSVGETEMAQNSPKT